MKAERYILFILAGILSLASCKMMSPLEDILEKAPDNKAAEQEDEGSIITPWGAPRELTALSGLADRIALEWKPVEGASYYLISYTEMPFGDFSTPLDEVKQKADFSEKVSWQLKSSTVDGLTPGAVYYFRIRAVNSKGTVSDFSSMVAGAMMDTPRIAEPDLKPGELTIRWYLPNLGIEGISYTPRFTIFTKEGDGPYTELPPSSYTSPEKGSWSFTHKSVNPKTLYSYKIQVDVEGSEQSMISEAYEVLTMDQTYPNPVASLSASLGTLADSIEINWTPPVELAGYEGIPLVYTLSRQTGEEDPEILADKLGGINSWTDNSAETNKDYLYSLTPFYSYDKDGSTVYSPPAGETTTPGYRLWEPTGLSVTADGGAALISWNYPAEKAVGISFRVYREEDLIGGGVEMIADGLTTSSFRDETLSPLISYHYRVAAVLNGGSGELSRWLRTGEPFCFTPGGDDTVRNFSASEGMKDSIALQWTGLEGVAYSIYRNTTGYSYTSADLLISGLAPDGGGIVSYSDGALDPGTVYYYRVESELDGTKYMTNSLRGYTLGIPADLEASRGLYSDRIALTWSAVEGADAYRLLHRQAGSGSPFTEGAPFRPADPLTPATEFSPPGNEDPGVRGILWEFALRAINETEGMPTVESTTGLSATGSTLGPALADLRAGQAEYNDRVPLTWNAVEGADRYDIYRNTSNNPLTAVRILQGIRGTTAEDLDTAFLTGGGEYWYFIRALGPGISSNILSIGQSGYALSPPPGQSASKGSSASAIDLSWNAAPGALSYNVYRESGNSWIKVGSAVTGTSWTYPLSNQDLNNGDVKASFRVRSLGGGGLESLPPAGDTEGYALSRPLSLTASKGDPSLLQGGKYYTRIFWPAVEGAESYRVQRLDDRSGDWQEAGTVSAGSAPLEEFRDFDALILKNHEQRYRVLTQNGSVSTSWSDETSGFRQISAAEFLNMVNYTLRSSMKKFFYISGSAGGGLISESRTGNRGGSYTHGIDRDGFFGSNYRRYYSYSDYSDYSITLNGSFMKDNGGGVSGSAYEGDYKHQGSDTAQLTITGPAGTSLYSGTIRFENLSIADNNLNNPNWDSGSFTVVYNGETVSFNKSSGIPISYFMDDGVLLGRLGY